MFKMLILKFKVWAFSLKYDQQWRKERQELLHFIDERINEVISLKLERGEYLKSQEILDELIEKC